MSDDYKGNKHIPNSGIIDTAEEPATTPEGPVYIPTKDGEIKNVLTDHGKEVKAVKDAKDAAIKDADK